MSSSGDGQLAIGDKSDMRDIISWQQERYRHLQLLSQGFLASSLTILAVVATVFTAFGSPLPEIPIPDSPKGPEYVGIHASTIIIGFGNFMWILLGLEAIIMFFVSMWKFVGLVLERPLLSDSKLSDMLILGKSSSLLTDSEVENIDTTYQGLIHQNNRDLDILRQRFRFAGFRFPGSLLIAIGAVELYVFTVNFDIISIVLASLLFTIPSITNKIIGIVSDSSKDKNGITTREITLFQEFKLAEEHELSRWNDIDQFWWEKLLFSSIQAFSTIILISFLLSYFI